MHSIISFKPFTFTNLSGKFWRQSATSNSHRKQPQQILAANPHSNFPQQIATENSRDKFPRQILK